MAELLMTAQTRLPRTTLAVLDRLAAERRWSRATVLRVAAERFAAEHAAADTAERIEVRS